VQEYAAGAAEYLGQGDPLPAGTLKACRQADAVLLGATDETHEQGWKE